MSNKQVFASAVKDTLLFNLLMRKKMLLSVLVLEDGGATIHLAPEFRTFQLILKYSIQLDSFALLVAFWTFLLSFQPLVDALPTEKTIAF